MTAITAAIARASRGLDWSYPCLIWVADYLSDATGRDPAESWRHVNWNEEAAKHSLARLAAAGEGDTAVERALSVIASREGWEPADGPRQGAVMIGVYTSPDGEGAPAIFDGSRRWIVSINGTGWTSVEAAPGRMWEVKVA